MTTPRILMIAAVGAGVDGAARRLVDGCRRVADEASVPLGLVCDPQLRVEHALDLTHSDLAIFVGEAAGQSQPVMFGPVDISVANPIASVEDTVTPGDIVHTLATLGRRTTLPRCYTLTLDGDNTVDDIAAAGLRLLRELLEDPDPERWDRAALPPA